MSTTEVSDVFEFHLTPMDPSPRADEVQRLLEAAVAEAAQEIAGVTSASAELQETATTVGEAVVVGGGPAARGARERRR